MQTWALLKNGQIQEEKHFSEEDIETNGKAYVLECFLDDENEEYLTDKGEWTDDGFVWFIGEDDYAVQKLRREPVHSFSVSGYEAIERTVTPANKSSGRVYLPNAWIGKRVMIVRLE